MREAATAPPAASACASRGDSDQCLAAGRPTPGSASSQELTPADRIHFSNPASRLRTPPLLRFGSASWKSIQVNIAAGWRREGALGGPGVISRLAAL